MSIKLKDLSEIGKRRFKIVRDKERESESGRCRKIERENEIKYINKGR